MIVMRFFSRPSSIFLLSTLRPLSAGVVSPPWQVGLDFSYEDSLDFASIRPAWISDFMGGKFSVRRKAGLQLGGFDEQFVGAAYNFEPAVASRNRRAGHRIYYE